MLKKKLNFLIVAFLGGCLMFSCSEPEQESIAPQRDDVLGFLSKPIPGRYIVTLANNANGRVEPQNYAEGQELMKQEVSSLFNENNIQTPHIRVFGNTIRGFVADLTPADLDNLRKDPSVLRIEQDQEITMKRPPWERDGGGDDGDSTGEEIPSGITRVNGGATYTGSNVAWILDTGIDLDHEDLNVDASRGFNAFTSGKDGKSTDDGNGHGTHVAGTIAAVDNEVGVVGVAAGATVIPVKVLGSRGSGSYSGVIAGIDFVGANGSAGDVANMSLGGGASQAVDDAVIAASSSGVIFALAAGNESSDANGSSPARANGPNIVTISAMDASDNWASFSNYGNPPVDFCAPGVGIKSTWKNGGYNTISGTSMATPHAAGVLLLGAARTDGTVNGDPDGNNDPIIVH
ncbi:MAG: S8 family serine peptidase [Cyclobacteriaceae bacterium]